MYFINATSSAHEADVSAYGDNQETSLIVVRTAESRKTQLLNFRFWDQTQKQSVNESTWVDSECVLESAHSILVMDRCGLWYDRVRCINRNWRNPVRGASEFVTDDWITRIDTSHHVPVRIIVSEIANYCMVRDRDCSRDRMSVFLLKLALKTNCTFYTTFDSVKILRLHVLN